MYVHVLCMFMLSCVFSGFARGSSSVQGVLSSACKMRSFGLDSQWDGARRRKYLYGRRRCLYIIKEQIQVKLMIWVRGLLVVCVFFKNRKVVQI
jgi:hypothetical protein